MIDGLVVDSFAGGGGASTGITMALGRSPDIAINHDAEALALQIRMCGNSVCPQVAEALVRSNLVDEVGHHVRDYSAPMEMPLWQEAAA